MVKGVYVLVISVGKNVRINVGALGAVNFEKACMPMWVLPKTV